jgi:hypothetical protein
MTKLIGTKPHQAPKNADLGEMAYQNKASVNADDMHVKTLEIKPEVNKQGYALVVKTNHANNPIAMSISDAALLNGIAFSQQAFTPLCVGRDSGSTFSAFFNGRVAVAAGYGINFGATSSSPSGYTINNNTMDDYEEGTWTPIPRGTTTGSSTDAAFTSPAGHQNGHYTKIGQTVHYSMMLYGTNFNGTGTFEIHGLPFSLGGAAATAAVQANNPPWATLGADNQNITAYPTVNKIAFRATSRNGGGNMVVAQCGGSTTVGYIRISGVYHTND